MEIVLPSGCGNAPRIEIIADFAASWAASDAAGLTAWLTDDSAWTLVGASTQRGADALKQVAPPSEPERMELTSIITHGRLASCDGHVAASNKRIDFSHGFRFANTAKTAKIVELCGYCVVTPG